MDRDEALDDLMHLIDFPLFYTKQATRGTSRIHQTYSEKGCISTGKDCPSVELAYIIILLKVAKIASFFYSRLIYSPKTYNSMTWKASD